MRPYNRYTSRRSGTDAQIVRPNSRYTSRRSGTDAQIVRPYDRYTSRRSGTDAQIVRPYDRYSSRRSGTDAVTFDTTDAPTVCVRPFVPTAELHVTGTGRAVARHYLVPLPAVDVSS